jgi:bifunctional non-homologous end joining protein LigD
MAKLLPLSEYRAKRNFAESPEPAGRVVSAKGRSFCVQKHLASHLHYDLRLEHNGVLLSWAVPKGPSLNPADKRMAVRVEDHPVDYGVFEGIIPSGYGAGVVMLWDQGSWAPEPGSEDVDSALKRGELKFRIEGVKLKGSWVLVRTRRPASAGREAWLLIKHRDHWAGDIDITQVAADSIKTFGSFGDILSTHDLPPTWRKRPPAAGGEAGELFRQLLRGEESKHDRHRTPVTTTSVSSKPVKTARLRRSPGGASKATAELPRLTNVHKVMFPAAAFTKGDLIDYYRRIARLILPHLKGRAVTLKRFPDGVDGKSFFEKHCTAHRPDWVQTVIVPTESGKSLEYCTITDERSLLWAANLAAIELHVPLALADQPDRPTAMVFDLDPGPPATLKDCVRVAHRLKSLLDAQNLKSVAKLSGGKGLHILVPLNGSDVSFNDTKTFARAVAVTLEKDDPKRVIASMSRAARAGKVFIDWSQNDRNKTTVCVYSVRAATQPSVSWPIAWEDLNAAKPLRPVLASHVTEDAAAKAFNRTMRMRQNLMRSP